MGCNCSQNVPNKVIKMNKLADLRSNLITVRIKRKSIEESELELYKKINMFNLINRKCWIVILDFLTYKDLFQAGQLNK